MPKSATMEDAEFDAKEEDLQQTIRSLESPRGVICLGGVAGSIGCAIADILFMFFYSSSTITLAALLFYDAQRHILITRCKKILKDL